MNAILMVQIDPSMGPLDAIAPHALEYKFGPSGEESRLARTLKYVEQRPVCCALESLAHLKEGSPHADDQDARSFTTPICGEPS